MALQNDNLVQQEKKVTNAPKQNPSKNNTPNKQNNQNNKKTNQNNQSGKKNPTNTNNKQNKPVVSNNSKPQPNNQNKNSKNNQKTNKSSSNVNTNNKNQVENKNNNSKPQVSSKNVNKQENKPNNNKNTNKTNSSNNTKKEQNNSVKVNNTKPKSNPKKNNVPKAVTETNQPKKTEEEIKVFSLGGLGVVGMNMYIVEQGNELIIMDAGVLFADDEIHGVNYIIPDFTYLEKNEKKIIGLFITHGHEDHIGAIPFLLQKVKIPTIYASGLAVGLIRNKMNEFPDINYNITEFNDDSLFKFKHFQVSFFRTNHSIPDSFGIAINTKLGYIVNTGDFKFDLTPLGKPSDIYKMSWLGKQGVYCLLSESTNADIKELSASEKKIGETLSSLFHQIEGRIIVATFASNVYRVQQIIEASIDCGRQVIVFGHSMELTIEVAQRLNYINAPKGWILRARDLKKIESEHVTILCTGSQGEPVAALSRIASGTHKQISLLPNDTIIYSSKPIPGNEQFVNRNIDKIVHSGAHVIINSMLTDTHTTGHASQQELKLMLSMMKPKYFVPVHGEYAMLKQHVELAVDQGVPKENCFVLGPGDVLNLTSNKVWTDEHAVPVNDVFLDSSLSDVDSTILKERVKMADDGLVNITFYVDKKKKIYNQPIIELRGFSIPDMNEKIVEMIKQKSIDIYSSAMEKLSNLSIQSLEKQISNQIDQFIYHKMLRNPLVVVSIITINR